MIYKILLVNSLTFMRVVLTLFYCRYIFLYPHNWLQATLLLILIGATDFIDGRLARRIGACSHPGAVFDVAADLLFIVSACTVLLLQGILPPWFLLLILLKFAEFLVTSAIMKKAGKSRHIFLSDPVGRVVAVCFYLMPPVTILLYNRIPWTVFGPVIQGIGLLLAILSCLSSRNRIKTCRQLVTDCPNSVPDMDEAVYSADKRVGIAKVQ